MIGKKDGTPGLGVSLSNKAEVYGEANDFCARHGQEVYTIEVIVTAAAPAQLGSTELHFKCVSPGSAQDEGNEDDEFKRRVGILHEMDSARIHSFVTDMISEHPSATKDPLPLAALGVLRTRAHGGDEDSFGPYGATIILFCGTSPLPHRDIVCTDAAAYLTKSANTGDPYSMHNLAACYRLGIGVQKSMYAAADWYVASSDVFIARSLREAAMAELEHALTAVPDHPVAAERLNAIVNRK